MEYRGIKTSSEEGKRKNNEYALSSPHDDVPLRHAQGVVSAPCLGIYNAGSAACDLERRLWCVMR
jgi:hypothetical protein